MGPRIYCDNYETYVQVNLQIARNFQRSTTKKHGTLYDLFITPFVSICDLYNSWKKEQLRKQSEHLQEQKEHVRRQALNKYYELQRTAVSYLPIECQYEIFAYL